MILMLSLLKLVNVNEKKIVHSWVVQVDPGDKNCISIFRIK